MDSNGNISNIFRKSSPFTTVATVVESTIGRSFGTSDVFLEIDSVGSPSPTQKPEDAPQLNLAYTASEGIVSLLAIFGNALVVYVFCKNRSLRRYRNYYIFALAIADFLVGLFGIPLAVLSSIGLPRNLYGCLFTVSILMVLCTISILCLVAVSIDRFFAITNPFAYYRHMTTSTAVGIILSCWIVGALIGFLPLFGWYNLEGWHKSGKESCYFTSVMDYNYLVFLYFATIIFPAILMATFYGYIYHVVLIKIRQKGNLAPQMRRPSEQSRSGSLNSDNRGTSQILRIVVSEKRREAKAAHKLGIIFFFFFFCWMPLYSINCIQAFCPNCHIPIELLNFTIILSHANSSLNPLLYAYHLKEFRGAMKNALLQLADKLCCGLMGDRLQKDDGITPGRPLSRCHTLPSITHAATLTTSTGKMSMKFRHSPRTNIDQSRPFIQISPKQGSVISNSSNLQHITTPGINASPEKSVTNLSIDCDIRSVVIGAQEPCFPLQPQRFAVQSNNNISPNDELYLEDPSVQSSTESINCLQRQHQQNAIPTRIQHGIEIHVVNTDAELGDEGCKNGGESYAENQELESKRSQIPEIILDLEIEENNELNSIITHKSNIQ